MSHSGELGSWLVVRLGLARLQDQQGRFQHFDRELLELLYNVFTDRFGFGCIHANTTQPLYLSLKCKGFGFVPNPVGQRMK